MSSMSPTHHVIQNHYFIPMANIIYKIWFPFNELLEDELKANFLSSQGIVTFSRTVKAKLKAEKGKKKPHIYVNINLCTLVKKTNDHYHFNSSIQCINAYRFPHKKQLEMESRQWVLQISECLIIVFLIESINHWKQVNECHAHVISTKCGCEIPIEYCMFAYGTHMMCMITSIRARVYVNHFLHLCLSLSQ